MLCEKITLEMDGVQCVLIFLMGHYYGTFYNAEECVFEVFFLGEIRT